MTIACQAPIITDTNTSFFLFSGSFFTWFIGLKNRKKGKVGERREDCEGQVKRNASGSGWEWEWEWEHGNENGNKGMRMGMGMGNWNKLKKFTGKATNN